MTVHGQFYLKTKKIPLAEHTCVETSFTDKDGVKRGNWFYCHGDWDGNRIGEYSGNPVLAIVLCTYSNAIDLTREGYFRKTGSGWENLGDCVGVRYMWNGVCHQMANRILWACNRHPTLDAYVSSVPSYKTSRALYSVYGNAGTARWDPYLAECLKKYKALPGADRLAIPEAEAESADTLDGRMAKLEKEKQGYGEALLNRLELMLEDSDMAVGNGRVDISAAVKEFSAAGHRDEAGYAEHELATPEAMRKYMKAQDKAIVKLLASVNDAVGEEKYRELFGMPFDPNFTMSSLVMDGKGGPE